LKLDSKEYCALQTIFSRTSKGAVTLFVSLHTLAELARKPDAAYDLAKTLQALPHWLIGAIEDQVAMIKDLQGTWEDGRRNQEIQLELKRLAGSGNDIRDRGAYLDALFTKMDAFVTSDGHLVRTEPARRMCERFGLRVLTPSQLAQEVDAL
jgi:hypothetical protein